MKKHIAASVILAAAIGIVAGCSSSSNSSNPTGPSAPANLIANGTFASNGAGSVTGWRAAQGDLTPTWLSNTNAAVTFSSDVPPGGGGSFSIAMQPKQPQEVFLMATVPAKAGTHAYDFSVWGKMSGANSGLGMAEVIFIAGDSTAYLNQFDVNAADTAWTQMTASDTVTANAGDSIRVALTGGYQFSQSVNWNVNFDLVNLTQKN